MHISGIKITNFANFQCLDVATGKSMVVVGENKVGKSNFLRALQLVLDPGLSELDRHLGLEHFWDGLGDNKLGATVEISVELTGFDDNPGLVAVLADCIVAVGPPTVARLTYRFQPNARLNGAKPESLADYEYVLFGGNDEQNSIGAFHRRQFPLELQTALRDAEKDLSSWRRSPLRPLIEELTLELDADARQEIQELICSAQTELADRDEVVSTAGKISERMHSIVGDKHSVPISLGLAPTRVDALLRGLRIHIDQGARGIGGASLGTANLIFLALKSLQLDLLVSERERSHTFFAIEEPEAHLHPHVQRLVYRYFFGETREEDSPVNLTTVLTTHSPHIASVAPIRSVVLLRRNEEVDATVATSTAMAPLDEWDEEDLQRYIDVTRGELFFARGVLFVEGDAERFLIPAYAEALGMPLDVLGISVCSVSGVNFLPYIKLVGSKGLRIPFAVLTDLDPREGKKPLGLNRLLKLLKESMSDAEWDGLDKAEPWGAGEDKGYFVNDSTLEVELFRSGLGLSINEVLEAELNLRESTKDKIQGWADNPRSLEEDKLLSLIERVGKGRFAQALASYVSAESCPEYIQQALEYIRDEVA